MVLNCFWITTWTLIFGRSQIRRNTKVQLFVHLFNIVCVEVLKDWISNHFNLHQKPVCSICSICSTCSIYVFKRFGQQLVSFIPLDSGSIFFDSRNPSHLCFEYDHLRKKFRPCLSVFFYFVPNQGTIWDIFAL